MAIPRYYALVSGIGKSKYPLVAFDDALLHAGISDYNLVKVSSILPPNCVFCERHEKIPLPKGSLVFAAYASLTLKEHESGSVAVGVATSIDSSKNGVIFELSSPEPCAETYVREMCVEAMANRGRAVNEVRSKSESFCGEPNVAVCGVAAVIMW